MKCFFVFFLVMITFRLDALPGDLVSDIQNVRNSCSGLVADFNQLKNRAGLNTAVNAVGTVAGGTALGSGIAKAKIDKDSKNVEDLIKTLEQAGAVHVTSLEMFYDTYADALNESGTVNGALSAAQLKKKKSVLDAKSKKLGILRTGMLGAGTAANIAGAIISGTNRVDEDLRGQIDKCLMAVKNLSLTVMQVRVSNGVSDQDLEYAENIVRECNMWSTIDVSSIDKRAVGATVSSGVGAGLGLVGTITSVAANSDTVRDGERLREKNLNTVSNVMAGGSAVASATAIVFNATQIAVIKRAADVANKCVEALK